MPADSVSGKRSLPGSVVTWELEGETKRERKRERDGERDKERERKRAPFL